MQEPRSGADGAGTRVQSRVAIWLSTALLAAFLNVLTSLFLTDFTIDLSIFLKDLAATAVTCVVGAAAFWFVGVRALETVFRLRREGLLAALVIALVLSSVFAPVHRYVAATDPLLAGILSALFGSALLLAIATGYLAASRTTAGSRWLSRPRWWIFAVPVAGAACVAAWLVLFRIEVLGATSGLPTGAAAGTGLAFLLVSGAAFVVSGKLGDRGSVVGLLTVCAVVIAAPLVHGGWSRISSPRAGDGTAGGPNVLLIVIDTLRADALGAYGSDRRLSPEIDRMAEDSVVFTAAYSAAPWTRPAMASMLTGLSPLIHQTIRTDSFLPEGVRTVAESFADRGYHTVAIGKNGSLGPFNFDQGFDEYTFYRSGLVREHPSWGARLLALLGQEPRVPGTDGLADAAIDLLSSGLREPFFFWLHLFDPHGPFGPPSDYLPDSWNGPSVMDTEGVRGGYVVWSEEERSQVRGLYEGEVRYVDAAVGRVLQSLHDLDLYNDTLIVLTSDHGEEFFEHGTIGHGHSLYEEVLRVPLIVKLPGQERRGRFDTAVTTQSVAPTLLDVAGLETDRMTFSSPSLVPMLDGQSPPESTPLLATGLAYYDDLISVTIDGFKYVRRLRDGHEELYVLSEDPRELESRIADYPVEADRARGVIEQYVQQSAELRRRLLGDEASRQQLDRRTLEDLRALGYVQ